MVLALMIALHCQAHALADAGWSYYGADEGGLRYSAAAQITGKNVAGLIPIWTFHTGDLERRAHAVMRRSKLEVTPILADGRLYICTPFNEVIALDPETGNQIWRFDPKIATDGVRPANDFNCRGVAFWEDAKASDHALCRTRIIEGTNDARLIALDARTGKPCQEFGVHGEIKIDPAMPLRWPGEFQITSAPVIVRDIVVVGSAIADNVRVESPHGTVRGFDVRSGALEWSWDPVPRDRTDPATASWGEGWKTAGEANVWAPMSADSARGLVFLPTSSPSPDFYGGLRPGNNAHANSVVALEAATGALRWSYQIVHHDIWDYDTPAQPTLATLDLAQGKRDVVIQGTKQGFVFVLDRDTGQPVFPVEERAVPQGGAAGEWLSPTQPFPTHIPALVPQELTPADAFGLTPFDRAACRTAIAAARSEGLYTPPSEQGTIVFPMTGGGINWGGVAFDPVHQILYANTNRVAQLATLFPAARFEELHDRYPRREVSPQHGAPFGIIRDLMISPIGMPCSPPPWGAIAALDLAAGKILWQSTLGTTEAVAPLGLALGLGMPGFGGPLVTAGGVVFIGAAADSYLRAFDAETGTELWQGRLPTSAQSTPMTFQLRERQYVVIAAGGHAKLGTAPGDSIVAFALPKADEAGPTLWSRTVDRPGGRFVAKMFIILLAASSLIWLTVHQMRKRRTRRRGR